MRADVGNLRGQMDQLANDLKKGLDDVAKCIQQQDKLFTHVTDG